MLIIVSREYEGFYRGLKARQEANGKDYVICDRRSGERRRASISLVKPERRTSDRRLPLTDAERALMHVLGFAVLHRELAVVSGTRVPRKPPARGSARQVSPGPTKLRRKKAAG